MVERERGRETRPEGAKKGERAGGRAGGKGVGVTDCSREAFKATFNLIPVKRFHTTAAVL